MTRNNILLLILIIGLLIFLSLSLKTTPIPLTSGQILTSNNNIPIESPSNVYVWTYWQGDTSNLVQLCLKQLDKSCAQSSDSEHTYIHVHVTPDNISDYLSSEDLQHSCMVENEIALRSDIIRLLLLKKYGGIWLDASTVVIRPVKYIFLYGTNRDFRAFYNPEHTLKGHNYPVIETWAIASPPNHPLITEWLEGFNEITDCTKEEARRSYVHSNGLDDYAQNLCHSYHIAYYILINIIKNKGGISNLVNVKLTDCKHTKCFAHSNYTYEDFILLSASEFKAKYDLLTPPFMKFINTNRKYIDNMLTSGCRTDCILLNLPMYTYYEITKNGSMFNTNFRITSPDRKSAMYITGNNIDSSKISSKKITNPQIRHENTDLLRKLFALYAIDYYFTTVDNIPTINLTNQDIQTLRAYLPDLEKVGFISFGNTLEDPIAMSLMRNGEYVNLHTTD